MKGKTYTRNLSPVLLGLFMLILSLTSIKICASADTDANDNDNYSIIFGDQTLEYKVEFSQLDDIFPETLYKDNKVIVNDQGVTREFTYHLVGYYDENWKRMEDYGYTIGYAWIHRAPVYSVGNVSKFIIYIYKCDSKGRAIDEKGNILTEESDYIMLAHTDIITLIGLDDHIGTTIGNLEYLVHTNNDYASVYSDNTYSLKGHITLPEKVTIQGKTYPLTTIGDHAFSHCKDLTSVTIPKTVTTIEMDAFINTGLTQITIPDSVTYIYPLSVGFNTNVDLEKEEITYYHVPGFVIYTNNNHYATEYAYDSNIPYMDKAKAEKTKPTLTVKRKKGKKVLLKWKKVNYVSGYQIVQSKKKNGKYSQAAIIKSADTVKWNSKKLKKGSRVYYKIRTYTDIGESRYYGKWSATKSTIVK